jgi:superfamily II DNA or RNA helicase
MINEERDKLQEEAYNAIKENNFNAAVVLPTGSGKSNIIVRCLRELLFYDTIIYCCDNKDLRDIDFPNELKLWGLEEAMPKVERKCYKSAYKMEGRHFNVAFLDEGDVCLAPEYIKFLKNNTFDHIIFLSATLEDKKRKMLEQFIPVVYEKTLGEVEGTGVINEAEFYFVNFLLNPYENRKYLAYNEAFSKAIKCQEDENRLEALRRKRKLFLMGLESSVITCRQLMSQLYRDESNKMLIFCGTKMQAEKVCKFSYHSENAKDSTVLDDLNEGKIRTASVIGKIDRGKNLKGVNTIIFEAPMASKTKFTQKSGKPLPVFP